MDIRLFSFKRAVGKVHWLDVIIADDGNISCGRRKVFMSKEQMIKKLSEQLIDLSDVFISSTGCHGIWGEVEVPECLRKELENREEEE